MTAVLKELYDFWNGFTINAYPERAVPDDAQLPYITYDLKQPNWRGATTYNVRVWYKDTSYTTIAGKVSEISQAIGEGVRLNAEGVIIYLFKDENFLQWQPVEEEEEGLKVAYLSMIIHVLA